MDESVATLSFRTLVRVLQVSAQYRYILISLISSTSKTEEIFYKLFFFFNINDFAATFLNDRQSSPGEVGHQYFNCTR
jgi:hypothetical protein